MIARRQPGDHDPAECSADRRAAEDATEHLSTNYRAMHAVCASDDLWHRAREAADELTLRAYHPGWGVCAGTVR